MRLDDDDDDCACGYLKIQCNKVSSLYLAGGKNEETLHFASKQQCRVLGILSVMSQGSLFHFVGMLCHIKVQSVFSVQK